jgi:hypothetical protein
MDHMNSLISLCDSAARNARHRQNVHIDSPAPRDPSNRIDVSDFFKEPENMIADIIAMLSDCNTKLQERRAQSQFIQ